MYTHRLLHFITIIQLTVNNQLCTFACMEFFYAYAKLSLYDEIESSSGGSVGLAAGNRTSSNAMVSDGTNSPSRFLSSTLSLAHSWKLSSRLLIRAQTFPASTTSATNSSAAVTAWMYRWLYAHVIIFLSTLLLYGK
jgi:hypothetical protein